jgi:hypothetical protein
MVYPRFWRDVGYFSQSIVYVKISKYIMLLVMHFERQSSAPFLRAISARIA